MKNKKTEEIVEKKKRNLMLQLQTTKLDSCDLQKFCY